jgi:hypothetical protein
MSVYERLPEHVLSYVKKPKHIHQEFYNQILKVFQLKLSDYYITISIVEEGSDSQIIELCMNMFGHSSETLPISEMKRMIMDKTNEDIEKLLNVMKSSFELIDNGTHPVSGYFDDLFAQIVTDALAMETSVRIMEDQVLPCVHQSL